MNSPDFDSEFTNHPNFRVVSAFFSGFVFWGSLCHLAQSPFARYIKGRLILNVTTIWKRRYSKDGVKSESEQEAQNLFIRTAALRGLDDNRNPPNESIFRRQDNPVLNFVLTLLFLMAGLSQLLSLLVLDADVDMNRTISSRNQIFCAFLIAWHSMSFQTARLIGLTILGLNLASLGARRIEGLAFWFFIGVDAVLIIVSNALGTGILKFINLFGMMLEPPGNKATTSCHRRHSLAPSMVLSLIAIGQEIYCIVSFLNIISPPSFPLQRRINTLFKDMRIIRAFSLLFFDLIILVPNAIETTSLGNSLPFSIGALVVLVMFNNYHPPLPLFHRVTGRTSNDNEKGPAQSAQYKNLVIPRHPYSAVAIALASTTSKPAVRRADGASGITTTSRSDAPLLGREVRFDTYSKPDGLREAGLRKPALPPIPPDNLNRHILYTRSRPSSRSRSRGSRRTRTSSRSQKSQLIRPIVPKAELARQFDDSERRYPPMQVLAPRPPGKAHNRSRSSPIQELPRVVVRSNTSETRRHSIAASTARTYTSASIRYGSDILRPEPGRTVRDKMRVHEDTRAPPSPASVPKPSVVSPSVSSSYDSWLSDSTVNALTVARYVRPMHSVTTFNGGWPVPPSTVPPGVNDERGKGMKRPFKAGLPSTPAPSRPKVAQRPDNAPRVQSRGLNSQRPRSMVRRPRMPSSPPHDRLPR